MDKAISLSKELNDVIKESECYRYYCACRENLSKHPDLLNSLNDFKRKNMEIQSNEEIENPFEEINELVKEYDDVVHDTVVNDYLKAERRFCRMMKTIYEEIADGLSVDIK